jgi:hypothetical protein
MNNGTFKDSKKTNHHHHSSIVTIMTTITRLARCAFVILSSTAGLVHSFAGVVHPQSRSSSFALFSSTADVGRFPLADTLMMIYSFIHSLLLRIYLQNSDLLSPAIAFFVSLCLTHIVVLFVCSDPILFYY